LQIVVAVVMPLLLNRDNRCLDICDGWNVNVENVLYIKDANAPGSLGCIVLPEDEFANFQKVFDWECLGHEQVKLWLQYDF
jgi:hypothetical protein